MGEERIIPLPPPARHQEVEILKEVPDPAVGMVLWQDVRHLRDWAESTHEQRAKLFNPSSPKILAKRREARARTGELSTALDIFARMKTDPLNVVPDELSGACEEVVEWALERGYAQTAVEFADVAAIIDPRNPKLANVAGRVTREVNEFDRSEVWFRRGIGIAREQGNIIEQFWGHVGYGKLCKELGRVRDARRHLNTASWLARKAGPPSLAASAQHDICTLLMVRGNLSEAAERARSAFLWYPKSDPRLPFFAADVALMLVLGRHYAAAARLLRPVLRTVRQPSARAAILALAARAFAGAGAAEEAALMRKRALRLLEKHPAMEAVARWHLADAFRLAGNWEAAQAEAEAALSVATARSDRETARMTRILLRLIADRKTAPSRSAKDLREFVAELAERVARWSPRRGRQPGPWGLNRAA